MKAKSIAGKTPREIEAALRESMKDGFQPTLAFVFLSQKQHMDAIITLLNERGISIFGATATGEFTDSEVGKDLITLLLLDMDRSCFKIAFREINAATARQTAADIAQIGLRAFSNPAYVISPSDFTTPGEFIVEGILDKAGPDATVVGGFASDDNVMEGALVFTNNAISSKGLVALIIDQEKIMVTGLAVSGWKPVGTLKTITRSEGSRVFTIDGQPALDLLIKFTGIELDLNDQMDIFHQLGSTMPLQVQKDEGMPVMKPPMMFNPTDRSILCGGMVPEGSRVRFSLPPDFDVIDKVIESAVEVKSEAISEVDAMLVFSCDGRFHALGPMVNKEIEGLQNVWKTPMAGFFSFGEFGKTPGGKSDFHGTTCSWLVLKEA